ncbi:MAG: hypothetical protein ACTSRZ_07150 [Promethearchaeota archaeon]
MSEDFFKVRMPDGISFTLPKEPNSMFRAIVKEILIPYYAKTNDWNASLRYVVNIVDFIRKIHPMPNIDYRLGLLSEIENQLGNEIAQLKGVDKIEILFLNLDDYTEEIHKIMTNPNLSKEERVQQIGDLIIPLTTFEISELLYHYISKVYEK